MPKDAVLMVLTIKTCSLHSHRALSQLVNPPRAPPTRISSQSTTGSQCRSSKSNLCCVHFEIQELISDISSLAKPPVTPRNPRRSHKLSEVQHTNITTIERLVHVQMRTGSKMKRCTCADLALALN